MLLLLFDVDVGRGLVSGGPARGLWLLLFDGNAGWGLVFVAPWGGLFVDGGGKQGCLAAAAGVRGDFVQPAGDERGAGVVVGVEVGHVVVSVGAVVSAFSWELLDKVKPVAHQRWVSKRK